MASAVLAAARVALLASKEAAVVYCNSQFMAGSAHCARDQAGKGLTLPAAEAAANAAGPANATRLNPAAETIAIVRALFDAEYRLL